MYQRIYPLIVLLIVGKGLYAQPTNTEFRSNWNDESLINSNGVFYNDIWGYVDTNGNEYAILGENNHTLFINVTDPDNPTVAARILDNTTCTWRDFKTFGHYAYGVSDNCNGGLEIFDLSGLPATVTQVYDSRILIDNAHNVFIDTASQRLYACGINHHFYDLTVLDLSTSPQSPTLLGQVNLALGDDYIHDLYVRNDTAYLCNGFARRMVIYDLSDISNISFLGQVSSSGYNHSVWISDNRNVAVIADETHNEPLKVVDISSFDTPLQTSEIKSTLLAPTHSNSLAHNPFIIENDFAVISYYEDGLQIYKIDSTHKPFRAGYYDTRPGNNTYAGYNGAWGTYPFLPSGNILVSDTRTGLYVITPDFPLRDCQSQVVMKGTYDNHWDITAKDNIQLETTFQDGATVTAIAPQSIELAIGFELSTGSSFSATIDDKCNSTSSFQKQTLRKPFVKRDLDKSTFSRSSCNFRSAKT